MLKQGVESGCGGAALPFDGVSGDVGCGDVGTCEQVARYSRLPFPAVDGGMAHGAPEECPRKLRIVGHGTARRIDYHGFRTAAEKIAVEEMAGGVRSVECEWCVERNDIGPGGYLVEGDEGAVTRLQGRGGVPSVVGNLAGRVAGKHLYAKRARPLDVYKRQV